MKPANANGMEFKHLMHKVLLANPYTKRGRDMMNSLDVHLAEDVFLKELYLEPFTFYKHERDEPLDRDADPDFDLSKSQSESEVEISSEADEVKINILYNRKKSFEDRLKELTEPLYVIKSGAGTGKSTYVHHLQLEYDDINFIYCNFEESGSSIALFGMPYDFEDKYQSNVWKFVSIVAEKVSEIICNWGPRFGFDKYSKYIAKIVKIYNTYLNNLTGDLGKKIVDSRQMYEFFSILDKYCKSPVATKEKLHSTLKNHVKKIFDEFEINCKREKAVTYICGILIRLLFCLNRITVENNATKRFVCVIDNIEYFVENDDKNPMQECELKKILDSVNDAIEKIKKNLETLRELPLGYKPFYGFLLVTRDTSVSLVEYQHYSDYLPDNELDITMWFCADDIYATKLKYFKDKIKSIEKNPYYIAYTYIMNDISQFNWGMNDFICKMYNYNYRRVVIDVIDALVGQSESTVVFFNEQWEMARDNNATKHMCRKFVFRILLDHINNHDANDKKKYFNLLMVESIRAGSQRKKDNDRTSYARRIATTLYRDNLSREGHGRFMSFLELIQAVLVAPYNGNPTKEELMDLGSILYLMNDIRNKETCWAPLILLNYDSERIYNEKEIQKVLIEHWEKAQEGIEIGTDKYGIMITYAGEFFARMAPDFEYFSCRFAAGPALMSPRSLQKSRKMKKYICLETIQIVQENAFKCIDELLERESRFFGYLDLEDETIKMQGVFFPLYSNNYPYKWLYTTQANGKLKPHPLRILDQHLGYLLNFAKHIKSFQESQLREKARKEILEGIAEAIGQYSKKKKTILEKYPDYFMYASYKDDNTDEAAAQVFDNNAE